MVMRLQYLTTWIKLIATLAAPPSDLQIHNMPSLYLLLRDHDRQEVTIDRLLLLISFLQNVLRFLAQIHRLSDRTDRLVIVSRHRP